MAWLDKGKIVCKYLEFYTHSFIIDIDRNNKTKLFTWICSISKHFWLIAIVQEVLDMKHFMMSCDQIFLIDIGAHFDAVELKRIQKLKNKR